MDFDENLDILASIIDDENVKVNNKTNCAILGLDKSIIDKDGKPSEVHTGDTDSSDDEDNRNNFDSKYNDFGKFVNRKLKENENTSTSLSLQKEKQWSILDETNTHNETNDQNSNSRKNMDHNSYFGINVVNPLISSQLLNEKMKGRQTITFDKLKLHINNINSEIDWVIAGAIVNKSVSTSKKGKQYCVWKISDLKPGLKIATLFLFGKAYKDLWKTNVGMVIAVLNPSVLTSKPGFEENISFSVHNSDQIMIWGTSKDLAFCKALTKSGDHCKSFVNKQDCEYCVYHVKREYKKYTTSRSELQSSTGGSLQKLKKKIFGKNEVFYGGRSFTGMPVLPKKSIKAIEKDKKHLKKLGQTPTLKALLSPRMTNSRLKDSARLQKLFLTEDTMKSNSLTNKNRLQYVDKTSTINTAGDYKQSQPTCSSVTVKWSSEQKQLDRNPISSAQDFKQNQPAFTTKVMKQNNLVFSNQNNAGNFKTTRTNVSVVNTSDFKQSKCDSTSYEISEKNIRTNTFQSKNNNNKQNKKTVEENKIPKDTHFGNFQPTIRPSTVTNSAIKKNQPKRTRFENLVKESPVAKSNSLKIAGVTNSGQDKTTFENLLLLPETKKDAEINMLNLSQTSSSELSTIKKKQDSQPMYLNQKQNSMIDLMAPITYEQAKKVKTNAVEILKKIGPLEKVNPNEVRRGKKRTLSCINEEPKEQILNGW
uniref:Uncharacterized protein n=1 Tax=Clastoptera arizonana TaxID=38151 RepID=A0A1B6CYM1_9HEMI